MAGNLFGNVQYMHTVHFLMEWSDTPTLVNMLLVIWLCLEVKDPIYFRALLIISILQTANGSGLSRYYYK